MTIYAHDREQSQILAVWPTGVGHTATVIAATPPDPNAQPLIDELCDALTDLSAALWDTYTQPVSATTNDNEHHARQAEKDAFAKINEAIHAPNIPTDTGLLRVSYIRVEESAHRIGRILHQLDDPTLTEAMSAETARETAAVEQAERGELANRAAQATILDRLDVSPRTSRGRRRPVRARTPRK